MADFLEQWEYELLEAQIGLGAREKSQLIDAHVQSFPQCEKMSCM